jgi:hypothetical protein
MRRSSAVSATVRYSGSLAVGIGVSPQDVNKSATFNIWDRFIASEDGAASGAVSGFLTLALAGGAGIIPGNLSPKFYFLGSAIRRTFFKSVFKRPAARLRASCNESIARKSAKFLSRRRPVKSRAFSRVIDPPTRSLQARSVALSQTVLHRGLTKPHARNRFEFVGVPSTSSPDYKSADPQKVLDSIDELAADETRFHIGTCTKIERTVVS